MSSCEAKELRGASLARSPKQAMSKVHRRCRTTQPGEAHVNATLTNTREIAS